ncbi:MAG: DNA polymerase Y family protein [Dehalococcoidia bacterium]
MRVACVLVDHFPFKLEAARDTDLAKRQVILFQRSGSRRTVLDVSPGIDYVVPGMSLQEAQVRCKDAALVEADISRYQRVYDHILLRLGEWSPVVERAELGCAYVGLNGLEDTYGSEDRLIDALLQSVPKHLEPRLGISEGRFPAYLAAMKAVPGRAFKPSVEVKEFLAPFSVDVLPVPWETKTRLHSFGLDTVGEVADLSIGPMQAQFGPIGAKLWRITQGIDYSPLLPQRSEEEVAESLTFATPTAVLGPVLMAVDILLARLFGRPEMRGRFARLSVLEGHVVNRPSWVRRIQFKTPAGEKSRAYFVIKSALENLVLPGPLEDIRLTLKELTGEAGRQESFFQEIRRREQLREAIAQLKVSQGRNPVYQVREVEPWSRIPERRQALVSYEP